MASIRLALLADAAVANQVDNKLSVIGGGIRSRSFADFPAVWPRLALALGIEFSVAETKTPEHILRVEAKRPDGGSLPNPLLATFTIGPNPDYPDEPIYLHFVYTMENIAFPKAGTYIFVIVVDDKQLAEVPLAIRTEASPVPSPLKEQLRGLEAQFRSMARIQEGYRVFSQGDIHAAEQIFREVVDQYPSEAMGHNNLGFVLLATHRPDEAKSEFDRARQLDFGQPQLLDANVACTHYLLGDPVAAQILFEQCLRMYGFAGEGVLFGINDRDIFLVQLSSAADYVGLMSLNSGWSALVAGDQMTARRHFEGADASELQFREDASGKNFAASVQALRKQLTV